MVSFFLIWSFNLALFPIFYFFALFWSLSSLALNISNNLHIFGTLSWKLQPYFKHYNSLSLTLYKYLFLGHLPSGLYTCMSCVVAESCWQRPTGDPDRGGAGLPHPVTVHHERADRVPGHPVHLLHHRLCHRGHPPGRLEARGKLWST